MTSMFRGYEVGAVDYLMKPVIPEAEIQGGRVRGACQEIQRLRESEDKLQAPRSPDQHPEEDGRTSRARSTTSSARC